MANVGVDAAGPSEPSLPLVDPGLDEMLDFLSEKPETELRLKNLQRGDPDLSISEKLSLLRVKLGSNPASFLAQYAHFLQDSHLPSFSQIRLTNYEVDFRLRQLEKRLNPDAKRAQTKNRRYEALQRLVDTSDYFTEEEMQRRNPILFDQLIGRFHTKEEREAFLFQSSKSSSSNHAGLPGVGAASRPTPLTDMLLAHMSRRDDGAVSERRAQQEAQVAAEQDNDVGMDLDEEEEDVESGIQTGAGSDFEGEEIEDEEKDLLKEEFFTTMYRHFLEGKDADFDYEAVDSNPDYDVGETLEQDEEEKYFEAEDPLDVQFQESLNVVDTAPSPGSNSVMDEDPEDELDLYMKRIDQELKKQLQ